MELLQIASIIFAIAGVLSGIRIIGTGKNKVQENLNILLATSGIAVAVFLAALVFKSTSLLHLSVLLLPFFMSAWVGAFGTMLILLFVRSYQEKGEG